MNSKDDLSTLDDAENRELYKQLRERVRQLRMREFMQEFEQDDWF